MSYIPNYGANSSIFWAYNSTAQTSVGQGSYFEVDTLSHVNSAASGGVVTDVESYIYGELQTSGQTGFRDKAQTRFTNVIKASGEGGQTATNKADSYDCDDGTHGIVTASQSHYLQCRAVGASATGSSDVDQTRFFGLRLNQ